MDNDKNSTNDEDTEKVIVEQQRKQQRLPNRTKQNARSDSDNDDINGQKSKDSNNKNKNDISSKASFQSNDPKLENSSEAKETGGIPHDNPNQQESQIMTPAEWAAKNGIPVEWLKGFKSFRAITKRYGTNDSSKFIQRIEEKIGRKVTFDEDTAIGNLFDELDQYRDNQQSNGM